MTNYEKIKNMSVEEFVEWVCNKADGFFTPNKNKQRRKELKQWLNKEVSE